MPVFKNPYEAGHSIFDFLRERADDLGRLEDSQVDLPDEKPRDRNGLRFAAGAMDGIFGHHTGSADEAKRAAGVAQALVAVTNRPGRWNIRRLQKSIGTDGVLNIVDEVIERLVELNHLEPTFMTWGAGSPPQPPPVMP